MTNVVKLVTEARAPDGLSRDLREMADAVDRGEITAMVTAYVQNDDYCFSYGASLESCLVLATLLQSRCIGRFTLG